MKKYEFCIHRFYLRSLTILYRCLPVFLLILVIIFLLACAEKRMTIDEAKKVTVSLVKEPFVSPPRRIDDILAILDQPGQFDSEIVSKTKAIADASPPETDNYAVLANFYLKRGLNARELGRSNQVFQDIHIAFKYAKKSRSRNLIKIPKEDYARIMTELGQEEAYLGNFKQGISLMEKGLDIHKRMGGNPFLSLGLLYFMAGDYNAGKAAFEEGIRLYNQRIRPGRRGYRGGIINRSFLRAELLKKEGNFAEEELVRRSLLKQMKQSGDWIKNHPRTYIYVRSWLAQNLAKQGRPIEAELEARRALNAALGYAGKESAVTARVVGELGKIMLSQKRLIDAEKLAIARTEIYEAAGASTNSLLKGEAIKLWCQVAMARLDYAEAMKRFEIAKETFLDNHYVYERFFKRDPDFILCLLKTGRFEEAIKSITSVYKEYRQFFGDNSYPSAEMLSLQGIASAMMGMTQEAMKYFSESVPILLKEKTATEGDYLKNQRLMIILEAYLDLLTGIHGDKFEKEFGVDASAESFKLVQIMIKSSVQSALGASGAREAAIDPELIGLVRREQDSLKQINALQAMLSNAIAMPPDQQRPDALKDLTARIDALSRARIILIDEIKRRFPKYSDFTDPQPVTFIQVQKHLRQGEVLISIYSTDSRTYVWAIPPSGEVIFSAVGTGKKKLRKIISKLRKALDPEPTVLGDIPEFNIALAYDLYSELLKPVEKGWENATDLLIVAHGPLGQIPFSILPTAPVDSGENEQELFGKYKKVPWLIRKASVTRLPSASTFVTLRRLPESKPGRKAFAGFGDPFFNQQQLTETQKKKEEQAIVAANQQRQLHVRGIRVSKLGTLDNDEITSSTLDDLNRLPDTAAEIKNIAAALEADPVHDVFLGQQASEQQVKSMDLFDRRVIAFATHALVPGDLDGLDQPALALSSPTITGDNEDGLLTMGEILQLKLNADWVVLSACNTGAAEGRGAEAISGLGRAFFYAGTRAILVSMWPVETTSARELTTGLFRYQQADQNLSRARALQKSSVALIDGHGFKDPASGQIAASYAHPFFWAPFIVVGESGRNAN